MFTGIIENTGVVKSIEKTGSSAKIKVEADSGPDILRAFKTGDSMAVDGACLTVTELDGSKFSADVSSETLSLTTLGILKPGDRVNLEPALTLAKPLGGHLVTGHIDGTGTIKKTERSGDYVLIAVSLPDGLLFELVVKGSVAVDGISLTVAGIRDGSFTSAIVPHTLKATTLSGKRAGSKVNIETDIIGKYVKKFLLRTSEGTLTEEFLREHGFIPPSGVGVLASK